MHLKTIQRNSSILSLERKLSRAISIFKSSVHATISRKSSADYMDRALPQFRYTGLVVGVILVIVVVNFRMSNLFSTRLTFWLARSFSKIGIVHKLARVA